MGRQELRATSGQATHEEVSIRTELHQQAKPLHIMMVGLRGFPNVQGGVETHCENLCPLLAELGCQVTVLTRSPYKSLDVGPTWNNVKLVSLWSPRSKRLETIVHTFIGVLYAAVKRPDILHIQAIGPSIMTVLARLLGLRVVTTHHGPDYDRQKWGKFAKFTLQVGERWGARYSHGRIVISKVIDDLVSKKYQVESELIPNGVVLPNILNTTAALDTFGLQKGKYVLLVSRLVPEKRHLDLIEAFKLAAIPDWKLVLVGDADHPDDYQRNVIEKASSAGVILTGTQRGVALHELYANAGLFVLPSSHEGLPIVLLEALSFGLPVLASDIPANLEVALGAKHYFPLGDIQALSEKIKQWSIEGLEEKERENTRNWVTKQYNWRSIAEKTLQLYLRCIEAK